MPTALTAYVACCQHPCLYLAGIPISLTYLRQDNHSIVPSYVMTDLQPGVDPQGDEDGRWTKHCPIDADEYTGIVLIPVWRRLPTVEVVLVGHVRKEGDTVNRTGETVAATISSRISNQQWLSDRRRMACVSGTVVFLSRSTYREMKAMDKESWKIWAVVWFKAVG